jgi:hypothetical protein
VFEALTLISGTPPVGLFVCLSPKLSVVVASDVVGGHAAQIPSKLSKEEEALRVECSLPLFDEDEATHCAKDAQLAYRLAYRITLAGSAVICAVPVGVLKVFSTAEPRASLNRDSGQLPRWLCVACYPDMYSTYLQNSSMCQGAGASPSAMARGSQTPGVACSEGRQQTMSRAPSDTDLTSATKCAPDSLLPCAGAMCANCCPQKQPSRESNALCHFNKATKAERGHQLFKEGQQWAVLAQRLHSQVKGSSRVGGGGAAAVSMVDGYVHLTTLLRTWQIALRDNAKVVSAIDSALNTLDVGCGKGQLLPLHLRSCCLDISKPVQPGFVMDFCQSVQQAKEKRAP